MASCSRFVVPDLPLTPHQPSGHRFPKRAFGKKNRAGGNGTACMAMAVPVFEGEKWRRLDSNLACVIECPLRALRRSLGRLRGL